MKNTILITMILIVAFIIAPTILAEEIIIKMDNKFQIQEIDNSMDNLTITHKFTSFSGMAVEVNQAQKEQLRQNPNIEIITNKKFTMNLDSSNIQVNASNSWKIKNNQTKQTNLTGSGQTVCLIDTGVNYNHKNLGQCYGNNTINSTCKVIGGYDFVNNDSEPNDDQGHGTHLAGIIISNDSTYPGIAPGANIIALKVLDENGEGNSADLISAIEWCTTNKDLFNITTISLSLGDETYQTNYCNSEIEAPAIQQAVNNNITVIVSAGNCQGGHCEDGITSPACIEGTIPVGTVNYLDTIELQRWPLFQILAPGMFIKSTSALGGLNTKSGASMSAAHVAGASAILHQLATLQDNPFPDIKRALNQSNTYINLTSESNGIKARLNILEAIYALDSLPPTISNTVPTNNAQTTNTSITFSADIEDISLENTTIYLYNSTGLVNITTVVGQNTQITIHNLNINETYTWFIESKDKQNKGSSQNQTFKIGGITTTQTFPQNNGYVNQNLTDYTCRAITDSFLELTNMTITIYTDNTTITQTKNISGSTNTTIFQLPTHTTWNCQASNNASQQHQTSNSTLKYDTSTPTLTMNQTPPISETTSLPYVTRTFTFNASDNINATCSLIVNDIPTSTINLTTNTTTYNITQNFTTGTHNWYIKCTDIANNTNSSTLSTFTIFQPASSTGGGSSGGGSSGGSSLNSSIEGSNSITTSAKDIANTTSGINTENDITTNQNSEKPNAQRNTLNQTTNTTTKKLSLLGKILNILSNPLIRNRQIRLIITFSPIMIGLLLLVIRSRKKKRKLL